MIIELEHEGRIVKVEFKAQGLLSLYGPGDDYTRELQAKANATGEDFDLDALIELETIYDRALAVRREI